MCSMKSPCRRSSPRRRGCVSGQRRHGFVSRHGPHPRAKASTVPALLLPAHGPRLPRLPRPCSFAARASPNALLRLCLCLRLSPSPSASMTGSCRRQPTCSPTGRHGCSLHPCLPLPHWRLLRRRLLHPHLLHLRAPRSVSLLPVAPSRQVMRCWSTAPSATGVWSSRDPRWTGVDCCAGRRVCDVRVSFGMNLASPAPRYAQPTVKLHHA